MNSNPIVGGILVSGELAFTVGLARGKMIAEILSNRSRMPTQAISAFLVAPSPAADAAGISGAACPNKDVRRVAATAL
jgi:hypothetical protein